MNLNKKIKNLRPVTNREMVVYTIMILVSLLTCYIVGVSIFVSGKPWDSGMTTNILLWLQVIVTCVIIIQIEEFRATFCYNNQKKKR